MLGFYCFRSYYYHCLKNSSFKRAFSKFYYSNNKRSGNVENILTNIARQRNSIQRNYNTKHNGMIRNERVTKQLNKSELGRLAQLAKQEKWKLTGGVCLLLISSAVTMAVPYAIGKVIDIIYTTEEMKIIHLQKVCKILIVIFIIGGAANFGRVYLMQISGQKIIKNLRSKVFSSILKQELTFFDKNKTGELINRLASDTTVVGHSLTHNISDGLRSFAAVGACISMMIYMSPHLALVGMCTVPPVAGMAIIYGRYIRNVTRSVQDKLAETSQVAEERISNIRTVKAFAQEDKEKKAYNSKLMQVLHLQGQEALAKAGFFGMAGLSGNLLVLTVLYYGGTMVAESQITIGDLSAFLLYAAYMGISLGGLSSFYSELMRGIGATSKLWNIIERKPAISSGLYCPSIPSGNIEFRNITFSYPTRPGINIFKDMNLSMAAGSVTAIVGGSGSGKSTLSALLLRFYDPQSGAVYLDGKDLRELDLNWLRSHIGIVSQEPILFSSSISENILYGALNYEQVSNEQLIVAAKDANAFDFIKTFPQQFETVVGERGIMLSGGQKQRIAIARAIIKNPQILILDEATSALDAESEALVQEALDHLMLDRTVIIIAHRLSTIKNADNIVVFGEGDVSETGSYTELMRRENSIFRKLVEKQTVPFRIIS